jgi:hypothetical protein
MIPFSLFFLYMGLLGVFSAPTQPLIYVFLAVGLYLAVGRFAVDLWRRSCTVYAITDRAALIDVAWPLGQRSIRMSAFSLAQLDVREARNGTGTIALGGRPERSFLSFFINRPDPQAMGFGPPTPSFESIPNVRAVEKLLRDVRDSLRITQA